MTTPRKPAKGAIALAAALIAAGVTYGCSKSSESNDKVSAAKESAPAAAADQAAKTRGAVGGEVEGTGLTAVPGAGASAADPASARAGALGSAALQTSAAAAAAKGGDSAAVAAVAASKGGAAVAQGVQVVGSDDTYEVLLDNPGSVASGADGTVKVRVVPKKGWKMNHEFPTQLAVTVPEGVTVSKPTQGISDAVKFDDKEAVFAVAFKPTSAGDKAFTAKFKFAVCTEESCVPKRQNLSWKVAVK